MSRATGTITEVKITPLVLPLKQPYHWSQGVRRDFAVNLIEVTASDGTKGYGECTVAPDQAATAQILETLRRHFVGADPFDLIPIKAKILQNDYVAFGANVIRAAHQLLAGFDFAVYDLQGKLLGLPVHKLLGGAHREEVGYFYFLQGDGPEDLARDAAAGFAAGERVFYLKVGRTEQEDIEIVKAVRAEIGDARLRLDANEAWDPYLAIRMCRKLEPFDIDFIEQPTPSWSIEALAHVRKSVGIPIVADQSAFTIYDVYEICRQRAADMICIGPREVGGIQPMLKAASIAEAAGIKICIHSSFTTAITTCAEHQIALSIPNLDDGNQIMWQLSRDNVVKTPVLSPSKGWLRIPDTPGLGFALDEAVIEQSHQRFLNRTVELVA